MKDFRPPDVEQQDVEETDDPVITSEVAHLGVAATHGNLSSLVEAAFDAHAPALKAFAVAAVRDGDAADDLVQETFVRFVGHVRRHGEPDNIPAWLHRVCANLVVSGHRRHGVAERKKVLLADTTVGASAEEHAIRIDEEARLLDGLGELPKDARAALLMAAAGFSSAEIGKAIGRSSNATSTYICRARVRLRDILSTERDGNR